MSLDMKRSDKACLEHENLMECTCVYFGRVGGRVTFTPIKQAEAPSSKKHKCKDVC